VGEPTVEDRVMLLSGIGHELGLPLDHIDVAWEHFWRLPPAEQVTYALDVAVASRVLPAEMSLAQIRRSLMLHVINIDAMRRYVARPVSCPLVILRASEELSLTPRDPALGWGGLTTGRVEVLTVPGNHFSMLREPHVQIVAERLRGYLEAATGAGA
jgi:thioesterase domain-containing protein